MPPEFPPLTPRDDEAMDELARIARGHVQAQEDIAVVRGANVDAAADIARVRAGDEPDDVGASVFAAEGGQIVREESTRDIERVLDRLQESFQDPESWGEITALLRQAFGWTPEQSREHCTVLFEALKEFRLFVPDTPDERVRDNTGMPVAEDFPEFAARYIHARYDRKVADDIDRFLRSIAHDMRNFIREEHGISSDEGGGEGSES